jgi:LmbE family N-acetylglucosaminyl deacetylase
MARVAVVVAHPDDEVLGVGGTILRHVADGDNVRVHIECMAGLRDAAGRIADAIEVAGLSGTHVTFGDSPQLGYAVPDFGTIEADIVYTHHPGDLNRDHRLVAEGVLVAARQVASVRTFETLSSTEWGLAPFTPTLYVGIDLDAKLAALAVYASELRPFPHPRSPEAVSSLARFRGSAVNRPAAEAFHLVREVR